MIRNVLSEFIQWLASFGPIVVIFWIRDLLADGLGWLSQVWSATGSVWLLGLSAELWMTRRGLRRLPRLPETVPAADALPSLSVLLAARNEEHTIENALRTLLATDYPNMQVIAVNDRSDDRTGAILECLAAKNLRLEVIHITELPPGWLGKNYALAQAASRATGEWLLFTDADITFAPSTIARAVVFAQEHQLQHVTAVPNIITRGLWLRVFLAQFSLALSIWQRPWEAASPGSRCSVGFGAFNLVKADSYRAIGGHEAIPLAVADDMALGRELKAAGCRQMLVIASAGGADQAPLSVEWYPDVPAAIRGFEKNAFALFNFQALPVVLWSILATIMIFAPLVALFLAPGWHRIPWVIAAILASASLGVAGRELLGSFPWPMSLLYPMAQCMLTWTLVRSAVVTLRGGGVRWRDTFYPLHELRGAQVGKRHR